MLLYFGKKVSFQPEKGAVLPKFGDWDASSATSGEGFTVIFNRARDEKKSQFTPESTSKPVSPLQRQGDEDLYQNRRSPNVKKKGKVRNVNILINLSLVQVIVVLIETTLSYCKEVIDNSFPSDFI